MTLSATNALGIVLYQRGDPEQALVMFQQTLDGMRRAFGPAHPTTLGTLANVGAMLRVMARLEESERSAAESVQRGRDVYPDGHPRVGAFLVHHGRTLGAMARFEEAERAMLEGQRILAAAPGADTMQVKDATVALVDLYTYWDSESPGEGHDASAVRWSAALMEE